MGYKQSLLQRLQSFEMSAQTKNQSDSKSKTETDFQPLHITDFSIQRILGDPPEKCKPNQSPRTSSSSITQDTPPTSPKLYAPVAHKALNTADILDLSKSKVVESYAASNLNATGEFSYSTPAFQYPAIHPNILAAVAAANAQKFYAQFFPHMFQGVVYPQHPLTRTIPTAYQKRYFAPYVLNNNTTSTVTSNTLSTSSHAAAQPPLTPPTPTGSQTLSSLTPNKLLCSRLDCVDCLEPYYKNSPNTLHPYPYKTPILSPTASTVSSTSSYHSKAQKDIVLGSSSISLTSVTNIHLPSSTKPSKSLYSNASIFDRRSSQNANLEEISYKCRICDKVFGCSQTLQAHEKTHKSPRYECTDCGKGFSQLRNYKYHLSVHRGTKEFAAECPECGKTFNDKGYLSSHMKIHRNKKEYECPYCPKSFNQRVAFNMHVRIHTGVKPHKCAECGKRFSRKMLLKQHMRTHSGEKPYQCSVCGKSFADRSNMTLHHRLHSGIKPFNCPICPKAFTKKHHLKTHLNYHTGCKPYVCPHPNCNQAFTQSSNMRTHAKKCQYRPLQITASYPERISTKEAKPSSTAMAVSSSSSATAAQSLLMTSISRLPSTATISTSTAGNLYHNMTSSVNVTQSNIPASFMASTTLSAGIRMLSTVSSTAPGPSAAAYPPAQQPLLSTLRPF